MKVLKSNRPKEQTDAQWKESTRKKLKDPDVMLKNYGGHRLVAQIELSRGQYQLITTILVHHSDGRLRAFLSNGLLQLGWRESLTSEEICDATISILCPQGKS